MTVTRKEKIDAVLNAFKLFKAKGRAEVVKAQKEEEERARKAKKKAS